MKLREALNRETFNSAPLRVKIAVVLLVLYLLNPIDLIPDFIPVIGHLDDIIIAGLVMKYAQKYTTLDV